VPQRRKPRSPSLCTLYTLYPLYTRYTRYARIRPVRPVHPVRPVRLVRPVHPVQPVPPRGCPEGGPEVRPGEGSGCGAQRAASGAPPGPLACEEGSGAVGAVGVARLAIGRGCAGGYLRGAGVSASLASTPSCAPRPPSRGSPFVSLRNGDLQSPPGQLQALPVYRGQGARARVPSPGAGYWAGGLTPLGQLETFRLARGPLGPTHVGTVSMLVVLTGSMLLRACNLPDPPGLAGTGTPDLPDSCCPCAEEYLSCPRNQGNEAAHRRPTPSP